MGVLLLTVNEESGVPRQWVDTASQNSWVRGHLCQHCSSVNCVMAIKYRSILNDADLFRCRVLRWKKTWRFCCGLHHHWWFQLVTCLLCCQLKYPVCRKYCSAANEDLTHRTRTRTNPSRMRIKIRTRLLATRTWIWLSRTRIMIWPTTYDNLKKGKPLKKNEPTKATSNRSRSDSDNDNKILYSANSHRVSSKHCQVVAKLAVE